MNLCCHHNPPMHTPVSGDPCLGSCLFYDQALTLILLHFCPTKQILTLPTYVPTWLSPVRIRRNTKLFVCVLGLLYAPLRNLDKHSRIRRIPTSPYLTLPHLTLPTDLKIFFFLFLSIIMFMTLRAEPETSNFRFVAQSSSPRRLSTTACYACRFKKVNK